MNAESSITAALTDHLLLCRQALTLFEEENVALANRATALAVRSNEYMTDLLARLTSSLLRLRSVRQEQPANSTPDERLGSLIQTNQDVMLRILVLSRETERLALERGLFAPSDVASLQRARPHYVSALYRRHSISASDGAE